MTLVIIGALHVSNAEPGGTIDMTDEEMLREFETGRLVKFRGCLCKILGIEFHGRTPSVQMLTFLLGVEEPDGSVHSTFESTSEECERVRKILAA
jgi:hypothetical protein